MENIKYYTPEMSIRDKLQREFADRWLVTKRGILLLTPRFGKIYTSINILESFDKDAKILIAYPDKEIKKSWEKDFITREYCDANVTYSTHLSLKKQVGKYFDIIIIDEIHLLSPAQRMQCSLLFMTNIHILGLTGTLMDKTECTLHDELDLQVIAEYTIKEGIRDKIIPDYKITIIETPLDNIVMKQYSKGPRTDKKHFQSISWVINKLDRSGGDAKFLRLARMRLIQKSTSKVLMTKKILANNPDERILVFCGLTAIADELGIPAYHAKVKEKGIFQDFVDGFTNHLAVVKIGNSGVTYQNLGMIIINYFDSNAENLAQKINRAMNMEFDNPEKTAEIVILCSDEKVELSWLKKALEFFDPNKISYIKNS